MSTSQAERLLTFSRKPAVRRSVIGLAAFVLLYTLFGFFVLPLIIKSQAEKLISEKLQRPTTIGKVDVNPYALTVALRDLKVLESEGGVPFAAFEALTVNLSTRSMLRLAPVVQEVRLSKPYLHVVRNDAHRYNFDDILERFAGQPPSKERARFSLNNIQVEQGRIEFEDRPVKTTHTVSDLKLGVPFISSLPSDIEVFVEPLISAKVNDTPVLIKGKARPFAESRDAVMELKLDALDVTRYLEYLPFQPRFKVSGARLDAQLLASFRQPADQAPALVLSGTASLKSARITELNGKPMLRLPELTATLGDTDVFSGRFELARVVLNGLEADVNRDRDGGFNLMRLLPPAAPRAKPVPGPAAEPDPVHFALGELQLRGATVRFNDQQPARSMRAGVEKFELALRKVAVDTGKRTVTVGEVASGSGEFLVRHDKLEAQAADAQADQQAKTDPSSTGTGAAPYVIRVGRVAIDNWSARLEDHSHSQPAVTVVAPLSLSMHDLSSASSAPSRLELNATVNKTGRVAINGNVGLAPLHTDLAMDLKGVDMLPLQPYLTDKVNLRLTRASLSGKGKLQLAVGKDGALNGGFKGDMSLDNLATLDKVSSNELLRWKSMSFGGMDIRLQPFALTVDQVALNDFFARVIIDSTGRINVQDIMRNEAGERKSLTDDNENAPVAPRPTRVKTAELPPPDKPKGKVPPISIGKFTLRGGRVRFTDNFIRPNYTATLTDFGGVVAGLSSDPSSSATVDLQGEVNRAPLSIAGRVNPLRGDLSLDVKAKVRGMELASLSAYSSRYIGYGIEKGKLSFEVAYRVENRKLTAENRLTLDQLTLGKKSDSPTAAKLPVQFAVALLRDRNGVIDLNVPIEGTLDDPQFSIGGIILKVIGNAILKAVTQPFALLSSIFGGGSTGELSSMEFEPGRSAIQQDSETKLKSLAKALADRPALKLDIAGRADPGIDLEGLKHVSIDRKVRALKLKDLQARGEPVEFSKVVVKPDEYPALLTRVYRDEKFTKPRNVIGMQKNLPVEEMEKLMIANTSVTEEDLISLGNRRAQAAKDWLVKFGQVSGERIFLLAAKAEAEGASGNGTNPAASRVDFSLR
jgi:uncharacterized protein involved in outer membrane biogenesis/outer membrane protein OmpA-like peptidoglycan-associated protein